MGVSVGSTRPDFGTIFAYNCAMATMKLEVVLFDFFFRRYSLLDHIVNGLVFFFLFYLSFKFIIRYRFTRCVLYRRIRFAFKWK